MSGNIICAKYDAKALTVYQAYSAEIATPAVDAGRFMPPFKMNRMTWIKPSFNWMMYRSGFGTKAGQEVILAIEITREGFEWALSHAVLAKFDAKVHESLDAWKHQLAIMPVRIQWDPARNCHLEKIPEKRAIQVGLTGEAVYRYVNQWILSIRDETCQARCLRDAISKGEEPFYKPENDERIFPVCEEIRRRLLIDEV